MGHRFSSLAIERDILGGFGEVIDGNLLESTQLQKATLDAWAVMLGTRAEIRTDTIRSMKNCRVIVRYGAGIDNIDVRAAQHQGIIVANVPDYCVEEVSLHALTLILAANRRLILANQKAVSGEWKTGMMKGVARLSLQTLGLVGFGRIGQAVAEKAKNLVGKIIAFDPMLDADFIERSGVGAVNFDDLLMNSDYVSIHCPLTTGTRHLFSQEALTRMKPSVWLINTARGEIIDEDALAVALREEKIGGAALDVLSQEPPKNNSPFLEMENVILTPHVAYYSESAIEDLQRHAAEQVRAVLVGEIPRWVIGNGKNQGPVDF